MGVYVFSGSFFRAVNVVEMVDGMLLNVNDALRLMQYCYGTQCIIFL